MTITIILQGIGDTDARLAGACKVGAKLKPHLVFNLLAAEQKFRIARWQYGVYPLPP